MNTVRSTSQNPRHGAVMVVAMICLMLVMLILGSLLKLARTHHDQRQWAETKSQATWLAESSIDRAANRLAADSAYGGELWEIPAADLDGRHAGTAKITVTESADLADVRVVKVEAIFPANATRFAKRTKQLLYRVEPSNSESNR